MREPSVKDKVVNLLSEVNHSWNPVSQAILGGWGMLTGRDALNGSSMSKAEASMNLGLAAAFFATAGESELETGGFQMTADQIALKELVDVATNGGRKALITSEAEAAMQLAREVNYPGFRASAQDLAGEHWLGPHFHLKGIGSGHIPIVP